MTQGEEQRVAPISDEQRGNLKVGGTLLGKWKGKDYRATVLSAKGAIALNVGKGSLEFKTLSAGAAAIAGHNMNGFKFWSVISADAGTPAAASVVTLPEPKPVAVPKPSKTTPAKVALKPEPVEAKPRVTRKVGPVVAGDMSWVKTAKDSDLLPGAMCTCGHSRYLHTQPPGVPHCYECAKADAGHCFKAVAA